MPTSYSLHRTSINCVAAYCAIERNLVISGKEDEVFLRFLALTPKRLSTARGTCGEQKGGIDVRH